MVALPPVGWTVERPDDDRKLELAATPAGQLRVLLTSRSPGRNPLVVGIFQQKFATWTNVFRRFAKATITFWYSGISGLLAGLQAHIQYAIL
jgi:hypothetical protein